MNSITELETLLNESAQNFPKITSKKMFGCHALWADGNVFALVWKKGRIGVKLPDTAKYDALMKITGADPWKAGAMQMSHWVLVPQTFHSKKAELKKWLTSAHTLCLKLEKKPKKKGN